MGVRGGCRGSAGVGGKEEEDEMQLPPYDMHDDDKEDESLAAADFARFDFENS